jgi:predicted dehydrogenase
MGTFNINNAITFRIDDACRVAGVRLGVAFMMRFQAQHAAALEMVRNGDLGKMVYGRAQLSCWFPEMAGNWRQDPALGGGGCLLDMGGHCIDLLEMFLGEVAQVQCAVRNSIHGYASEDSAVALLEFQSGAMGTVDTFFCIPDKASANRLELYGSKGSILAEGTVGQSPSGEMTAFLEDGESGYDAGQQARGRPGGFPIRPQPVNTYRAEIEEFGSALLEGRPGLLDVEVGLRSQRVLAACYESARAGRPVRVERFPGP